jgi:hypothetical protein
MSDLEASGRDTPEPGSPGPRRFSGMARKRMLKAVNAITRVLNPALDRKNTYRYKNIICDKEIRVFRIFPGEPGTKILGCLVPYPLLDQSHQRAPHPYYRYYNLIEYQALSYYWGDEYEHPENAVYPFESVEAYEEWKRTDRKGVLLKYNMVSRIMIRNNLGDYLEELRAPNDTVEIWTDALCS